jgi:ribosomal protein S19
MRSRWKAPFFAKSIHKYLIGEAPKGTPRIYARNSLIPENLLGRRVLIHNGMNFVSILLRDYHFGYKFGDLVSTKRFGFGIHISKGSKKDKHKRR